MTKQQIHDHYYKAIANFRKTYPSGTRAPWIERKDRENFLDELLRECEAMKDEV